MATQPPSDGTLARLRWRCRRGMRELDVLLQRYLDEDYPARHAANVTHSHALLELQDPELFGYLVGRDSPRRGVAA